MKEHEYLALSYTWGVESPTYPIVIDGKEFRVRENLWWFLSYVASGRLPYHSNADTGTSCYIWIDQICISQSSKKEKNHQVSMMSDIYRGAKEVVAWMGRETEKSLDCMQFLEQAADVFHAQLRDAQYEVLDPHLRFNLRFRNALDVLCRQPYWGRIWIIQEFAMAHRVKLTWGDMSLCVDNLRLSKILFEVAHVDRSDHVLYRLCKLRRETSTAGRHGLDIPFMELCLRFGDFACTNLRDTFYRAQTPGAQRHWAPT
ncbi:hypothetical protein HBH98_140760 [Parastagonospora nodorum]|nr:hypothetical protein HBH52_084920 [Parastagonospora nodorum]KAH4343863.1 hypothetical protein HBH98_140760 [Parastagonospora nodorum]KAH4380441.1 hypothetical protein HBH99_194990 [Parastagonospora nodorum]KAH4921911.1 hypothetical protein HBI79_181210 [Parastagonospora nodorum]KAH5352110.1 hypothetical protein HBI48_155520 [Parastagonospora nodorum]